MNPFSIWPQFGFRTDPYSYKTLEATHEGSQLLAGRDSEIRSVQTAIGSGGAHLTIEGPVGAGKTSLLNVAIFRMYSMTMDTINGKILYLPAVKSLQPTDTIQEFEKNCYEIIIRTLLKHEADFDHVGMPTPRVAALRDALELTNNPGNAATGNTTGLSNLIREEMLWLFGEGGENGGIVIILDNLENLQTASRARDVLEHLRDRVFDLPHIRWVLCGSRGLVSLARSSRLSGIFRAPLLIKPIREQSAVEAVQKRIDYFKSKTDPSPPITAEAFDFIYTALNSNLRDALTSAGQFSQYLHKCIDEGDGEIPDEQERTAMLNDWIMTLAQETLNGMSGIRRRSWQLFRSLCARGGTAGSSEYGEMEFENQSQMVSCITELKLANVVDRESHPDNGQKTVNRVTATGWLVYYFMENFDSSEQLDNNEFLDA